MRPKYSLLLSDLVSTTAKIILEPVRTVIGGLSNLPIDQDYT